MRKRVLARRAERFAMPAVGSHVEQGPVGCKVLVWLSSGCGGFAAARRQEPAQSDIDSCFQRQEGNRVPVRPPAAGLEPGILADSVLRSSGRLVGQQLPLPPLPPPAAAAGGELATGRSVQRSERLKFQPPVDWEAYSWRR